jgi:NADH-quinone oxidoreductase subunit C
MAEDRFEEALAGLEAGTAGGDAAGTPMGDGAEASSHPSVAALRDRFGDAVLHHTVMSRDEHVVYVAEPRSLEVLRWLKQDAGQRYSLLKDLTAVDFGGGRPLEVVYQLYSIEHAYTLRLKVTLPLSDLELDSVYHLWRTADWLEREVFDLFGIHFRGHPDLRRILMPENYAEGHPLRKDFPLRGRFSRAEQTRRALSMEVEDFYTPAELDIAGARPPVSSPATASGASTVPVSGSVPHATPGRPNDPESYSLGPEGSAVAGSPAPEGVSE